MAVATPAQAADQTINCGSGVSYPNYTASGSSYTLEVGSGCTNLRWSQTSGTTMVVVGSTNVAAGTSVSVSTGNIVTITNSGGNSEVSVGIGNAPVPFSSGAYVGVSFSGGGGGGDSSSSASAPTPVLETLTLEVSTGSTTCTGGSPTGYTGSWLQLPAADACSQSGPNANPNAKLLGWATDPIFPVAVAKEIVDLKYGPIDDYFYGMRMIFIPAGGWTYTSSSNNLYPIWSS